MRFGNEIQKLCLISKYVYIYRTVGQNSYTRRVLDCRRKLAAGRISLYSKTSDRSGVSKASRLNVFAEPTRTSPRTIGSCRFLNRDHESDIFGLRIGAAGSAAVEEIQILRAVPCGQLSQ